ncbi:hypothetical protein L9F63_020048, partial [Diploptera punctata]
LIAVKNNYLEKTAIQNKLAEELEQESICITPVQSKKEGKKAKEGKKEKVTKEKKKEETEFKLPKIETAEKKLTKLRKKGEEWKDTKYIADFPLDGPNLYVALVGFHEPTLLTELRKIGVPLHGLIKVQYTGGRQNNSNTFIDTV